MSGAEPSMSGAQDSVARADEVASPVGAAAAASASSALAGATEPATAADQAMEKGKASEDPAGPSQAGTAAASGSADAASSLPQVPPPAAVRNRGDSLSTGLPDDKAAAAASGASAVEADGVVCNITLLLPTGARHPYRIDDKYLAKRNVDVAGVTDSGKKDPFSISVYKLKELILREWRDDWEGRPSSPSSIRLIHFGKLLEDKEQLKKYHFSAEAPNVVHMSVKPAELLEEDEASKSKSATRDPRSREGGSGCCVIL